MKSNPLEVFGNLGETKLRMKRTSAKCDLLEIWWVQNICLWAHVRSRADQLDFTSLANVLLTLDQYYES